MKRAYENNSGGLSVVEYDNNGAMIAIAWGAEYSIKIDETNDIRACLTDYLSDWSHYATSDDQSDDDLPLSMIDDPASEPTTVCIGEIDANGKVTLYPDRCGHAGRRWARID